MSMSTKVGKSSRSKIVAKMLAVIAFLGVASVLTLAHVPATHGPTERQILLGVEAKQFLEARLAERPQLKIAYRAAAKKYGQKQHAIAVVRTSEKPVQQTLLRRISELVVPTLQARRFDDAYTIYDDYSGYDEYYDGFVTYVDDSGGVVVNTTFDKDPDAIEEDFPEFQVDCWGACEWAQPSLLGRVYLRIVDAAYPELHAADASTGWGCDRRKYRCRWAQCVIASCATAATACFIANVYDAEILWAPCFIAWCGGGEVGCLFYAMWSSSPSTGGLR